MMMTSQNHWQHVILETNASNVARSISHSLQYADDEAIVSFIRHLGSRLSSLQVQHCRRTANETAAELAGRQENFTRELDFVFADLAMAIIADFMLVWLPAPTVSLQPPLSVNAGCLNKFFYACPDNAFQVAFAGMSYSLLQRIGAIMRNGGKLFVVGTGASLIGTGLTVLSIAARIAIVASFDGETNDLPILPTSVAYGVFMAVSSNLRYQILAGVIEQRILEPLFHDHKFILGTMCFAIRTGNTFLGSLMWVAYAHWIGIQTING